MNRSGKRNVEQYADANGSLITIYRNLTARKAHQLARSHKANSTVSGRGNNRTVTIKETPKIEVTDRSRFVVL